MRAFTGYAAVYDTPALIGGLFYETIARGAFDRALTEQHDVRLLLGHDANVVLARVKPGTLRLSSDRRGLHVDADLPDSGTGRDVAESLRRGDLDAMSFGFVALDDRWDPGPGGVAERTVLDLELVDVSIVSWPAYQGTQAKLVDEAVAERLGRLQADMRAMDEVRRINEPDEVYEARRAREARQARMEAVKRSL